MCNLLTAIAVIEFALFCPTIGSAADWKALGGSPYLGGSAYIDMASVRTDHFSTREGGVFAMQPYKVVWLKFSMQEGDILAETVFNCRGGFAVMQQVVPNETAASKYKSFDNTQALRRVDTGAQVKSIPPDTVFEAVEKLICK